ncbi:MAG: HalOD1 output domain-containing protein [Haloferacaceae archaeon]
MDPVVDIVRAVADAKGTAPEDLDVTIHEHVDADAIRQLAAHGSPSWTLSVDLPDHAVTVCGGGTVVVDDRPPCCRA